MQATGIIAEYNPFHNGHLYHLQKTKELKQQPVIVVMSGSFMQRGEPAIINKWQRAKLAVENGAALVLELPCVFSLRSAEFFARSAVKMLIATGCVNSLCCGTENPQTDFQTLARHTLSKPVQIELQNFLKQGLSYAASWQKILADKAILNAPNDILALEYTKALQNSKIQPYYIQRQDTGYNSNIINGDKASASAIRQALAAGNSSWQQAVPKNTIDTLTNAKTDNYILWQLISYRLRLLTPAQIAECCEASEGIEYLLKHSANCQTLTEAVASCTRKRYTNSRIRRLLLQLLFDKNKTFWKQTEPAYLRVLAFNNTGRMLLKKMKQTASLPVITKIGKNINFSEASCFASQLDLDIAATDIWSMLQPLSHFNRTGNDFYISPIYLNN